MATVSVRSNQSLKYAPGLEAVHRTSLAGRRLALCSARVRQGSCMRNLKVIWAVALIVGLAGCQSPISDMMNNNFVGITPESVPVELVGTWTGNMGPYLVSLQWQQDGYGHFCYSYGTADVLQKIKFSGGKIFIQDGTRLEIKEHTKQLMTVHASYFAGKDSKLYSDPEFRKASAFCAEALKT